MDKRKVGHWQAFSERHHKPLEEPAKSQGDSIVAKYHVMNIALSHQLHIMDVDFTLTTHKTIAIKCLKPNGDMNSIKP